MIAEITRKDMPAIEQPIKRRCPETAYAKRQMQEFLDSGLALAEVTNIPAAYNTTRLYQSLKNAAWSLCDRPQSVSVMRRGRRIFLERIDALGRRCGK